MKTKMEIQLLLTALVLVLAALVISSPVNAGGWVVVTLDQLPAHIAAGQPYALGFFARQHGQRPWQADELHIQAKHAETGQTATFSAKPDQTPGHYQAELLFPLAGRWEWGIQSGMYPPLQPMPALEVTGSASAPASPTTASPSTALPWRAGLLGGLALLAFAAGAALIVRRRGQRLPRLAGGGLLVLSGLLVFAFLSSVNAQAGPIQPVPAAAASQDVGQQLFLAKGCVVCHVNNRAIEKSAEYGVAVGPDLSTYRNDPNYLRKFLANPKVTQGDFPMPNLGLSPTEIDALIGFINADTPK